MTKYWHILLTWHCHGQHQPQKAPENIFPWRVNVPHVIPMGEATAAPLSEGSKMAAFPTLDAHEYANEHVIRAWPLIGYCKRVADDVRIGDSFALKSPDVAHYPMLKHRGNYAKRQSLEYREETNRIITLWYVMV